MGYDAVAILWMIKLFLVYTFLVVIMPYIMLRPVLRGKAVSLQFLICVVFGNFYYINIVLFLGLFHISSGKVYLMVSLIPFLLKLISMRKMLQKEYFTPLLKNITGMIHGEVSVKFCFYQFGRKVKRMIQKIVHPIWCVMKKNILEEVLFLICFVCLIMYFAPYFYEHYGYRASDIVVQQQWINELDNGILFYDGIYPMGMHAMIYYIHAVFGIHTYMLMQFFPFVSDIYIFLMLLVAIKSICHFRYIPYIGYFCLIGGDYIQSRTLTRYLSALPQEFGMMFYLPCLTAAIQFFRAHIQEDKEYKKLKEENLLYTVIGQKSKRKESTLWLLVLIISFGLTFAVHFYITILAGFLVVAVAIGYAYYVFRPLYFKKLFLSAVIAIAIPLAPMLFAFLGGTPFQNSLYWATAVMGIDLKGAMTGVSSFEDTDVIDTTDTNVVFIEDQINGDENLDVLEESIVDVMSQEAVRNLSLKEKCEIIAGKIRDIVHAFYVDGYFILKNETTYKMFIASLAILLIQIPIMMFFKEWEYSRILTTVLVNHILLIVLAMSEPLGLPVLIDSKRMVSFQAYAAPLCFALAVDSCVLLGSKMLRKEVLWRSISFALALGFIEYSVLSGNIKRACPVKSNLQTDGAAMCLYDIIKHYPENKWTVVSCNEERNMMAGSGWHYEVIDFLQSMEHYKPENVMQIPTQYVFFYIEKESLNYANREWDDSVDPTVSEEWASKKLPSKRGLDHYNGTNRIILNSRMYYWMQEYKKRYPNDIKVYYEDEEFVCYVMEQNEYYLHNFAIDYGYNER